jgi:hypothetical protein
MSQRINYWEHATHFEKLDKLLDIIYMSEYAVWHDLFLQRQLNMGEFTYTNIINAYYDLTLYQ